jgi:hypothetical protein
LVEDAETESLKLKDLDRWKILLARRAVIAHKTIRMNLHVPVLETVANRKRSSI